MTAQFVQTIYVIYTHYWCECARGVKPKKGKSINCRIIPLPLYSIVGLCHQSCFNYEMVDIKINKDCNLNYQIRIIHDYNSIVPCNKWIIPYF